MALYSGARWRDCVPGDFNSDGLMDVLLFSFTVSQIRRLETAGTSENSRSAFFMHERVGF
jgi:hypothetical protein